MRVANLQLKFSGPPFNARPEACGVSRPLIFTRSLVQHLRAEAARWTGVL